MGRPPNEARKLAVCMLFDYLSLQKFDYLIIHGEIDNKLIFDNQDKITTIPKLSAIIDHAYRWSKLCSGVVFLQETALYAKRQYLGARSRLGLIGPIEDTPAKIALVVTAAVFEFSDPNSVHQLRYREHHK